LLQLFSFLKKLTKNFNLMLSNKKHYPDEDFIVTPAEFLELENIE